MSRSPAIDAARLELMLTELRLHRPRGHRLTGLRRPRELRLHLLTGLRRPRLPPLAELRLLRRRRRPRRRAERTARASPNGGARDVFGE